jgi:hypothetical protein
MATAASLIVMTLAGYTSLTYNPSDKPVPEGTVKPTPLASTSSVLQEGGEIVGEISSATVTPLNEEMNRLKNNMTETGQFLLASLP